MVTTQLKVVVSDPTFSDNDLHAKNLKNSLIHSRNIDGQQILQSDWLRVFRSQLKNLIFCRHGLFCRIIKNTIMHYS